MTLESLNLQEILLSVTQLSKNEVIILLSAYRSFCKSMRTEQRTSVCCGKSTPLSRLLCFGIRHSGMSDCLFLYSMHLHEMCDMVLHELEQVNSILNTELDEYVTTCFVSTVWYIRYSWAYKFEDKCIFKRGVFSLNFLLRYVLVYTFLVGIEIEWMFGLSETRNI